MTQERGNRLDCLSPEFQKLDVVPNMRVPTGSSYIFQVKCAYRDFLSTLAHGEFKWERKLRSCVGKLGGITGSKRRWKWITPGLF